jgi:Transient receptor potential (TRP) ion channel
VVGGAGGAGAGGAGAGGAGAGGPGAAPPGAPPPPPPPPSGYPNGASFGPSGNLGGNFGVEALPQAAGSGLGVEAALVMATAAGGGGAGTMASAGMHHPLHLPGFSHPTTAAPSTPSGHLGPPAGRMDPITLFLHFQAISSTGLLSLNYPILYRSFTTNFAWANFIIPLSAFKKDAERFRTCHSTSTSNIPPVMSGAQTGIAGYAQQIGVDEQDLFMVIFLVFLCACGILLVLHFSVGVGIHVTSIRAKDEDKKEIWKKRRINWQYMSSNNLLRLVCAHPCHGCFTQCHFCMNIGSDWTWLHCNVCLFSVEAAMHLQRVIFPRGWCLNLSRASAELCFVLHYLHVDYPGRHEAVIQQGHNLRTSMGDLVQCA